MSRPSRYPGYDVLDKRDTPSWDAPTRAVLDARLATPHTARFLDPARWHTLVALCERIVPQHEDEARAFVPVAAYVDGKLFDDHRDGFRDARLPPLREAWQTGLAALEAESVAAHDTSFHRLTTAQQIALLERMQRGELRSQEWRGMPCEVFFAKRVLHDVCAVYYAHPSAWSAIGFGGPANPRGYVRLYDNRRDPWEAVEAADDSDAAQRDARRRNARVR